MELVKKWLLIAEEDINSSKKLIKEPNPLMHTALYHTQQCVEKSLKGYLTYIEHPSEKTHDLGRLLEICIEHNNDFKEFEDIVDILTPFVTIFRYPGDSMEPDIEEVLEAIESAERIYQFVEKIVENDK